MSGSTSLRMYTNPRSPTSAPPSSAAFMSSRGARIAATPAAPSGTGGFSVPLNFATSRWFTEISYRSTDVASGVPLASVISPRLPSRLIGLSRALRASSAMAAPRRPWTYTRRPPNTASATMTRAARNAIRRRDPGSTGPAGGPAAAGARRHDDRARTGRGPRTRDRRAVVPATRLPAAGRRVCSVRARGRATGVVIRRLPPAPGRPARCRPTAAASRCRWSGPCRARSRRRRAGWATPWRRAAR